MTPEEALICNLRHNINIVINTPYGQFPISDRNNVLTCIDIILKPLLDEYYHKHKLAYKKRRSSPNHAGIWTYYQRTHRTNGVAHVRLGLYCFYDKWAPSI